MRVVLEAYWWSRGTQSLRHAVRGIVTAWRQEFPSDDVIVVGRSRDRDALIAALPGAKVVTTRLWPQALSASVKVPWVAWRQGASGMVVHNYSPLFGRGRAVLIHDLIFATNPAWFTRSELIYFRPMIWAAARAHVVFASTATEQARIEAYTTAPRSAVVGFGLGEAVRRAEPTNVVPNLEPGSFLLTVGRINERKNLNRLIEGAEGSGRLCLRMPLVIVGEKDGEWGGYSKAPEDAVRKGHVRFAGFLSQAQVTWLFQNCALFLSLSLDEGFGLPPIEARALGARVLVSDRPVFRETLRETVAYVDPTDVGAIAEAINRELAADPIGNSVERDRRDRAELLERHNWCRTVRNMRTAVASL